MIKLTDEIEAQFIEVSNSRKVFLEGNIIKLIEPSTEEFREYLVLATEKDAENRKKRLEVTRQFQDQNKELEAKATENDQLMIDLKGALEKAEHAAEEALNDLTVAQQKSQFELIGTIVNVALFVIVIVGVITTGMYIMAMMMESTETTLIGNTWSNLFGILLTNSFSIIGTIMGVKYASEQAKQEKS